MQTLVIILNFNNLLITDNYAAFDGAGIYLVGGNITFNASNCIFSQNISPNGRGGAIYNRGARNFNIDNSSFISNKAGGKGGAIYNEKDGTAKLINCTIYGNELNRNNSTLQGGGLYSWSGDFELINCVVANNHLNSDHSTRQGAGIYMRGNTNLTLTNTIVADNFGAADASSGNDIYDETDGTLTFTTSLVEDCANCSAAPTYNSDPNLSDLYSCGSQFILKPQSPSDAIGNGTAPSGDIPPHDICGNLRQASYDLGVVDIASITKKLNVKGNGQLIVHADNLPSTIDGTDFGSTAPGKKLIQAFIIKNIGNSTLNLSNTPNPVSITGNADFTILKQLSKTSLNAGELDTFSIQFSSTQVGIHQTSVNIASDDPLDQPFQFALKAQTCPVVYVNHAAEGTNNGTSWTNAYTNLQVAIDAVSDNASSCASEIWVAQGTYKPIQNMDNSSNGALDLNNHFYFNGKVRLFGGFSGTPGQEGNFEDRDLNSQATILSGDLDEDGTLSGNSYNVVWMESNSDVLLNGVKIQDGNANGGERKGGGIYIQADVPTKVVLKEVSIENNAAQEEGGGIYYSGYMGEIELYKCVIQNNKSNSHGGGLYNNAATVFSISHSSILNNEANYAGGGIYLSNYQATSKVMNCTILGNISGSEGGGLYLEGSESTVDMINCTVANNQSSSNGGGIFFGDNFTFNLINAIVADNAANAGNDIYDSNSGTFILSNSLVENCQNCNVAPTYSSDPNLSTVDYCNGQAFVAVYTPSDVLGNGLTPTGNIPLEDICGKMRQAPYDLGAFEMDHFTQEITVQGNQRTIPDGDVSPILLDFSHFGDISTGMTKTVPFVIHNIGPNALNLTNQPNTVTLTGDTDFTIIQQPTKNSLATAETDTFLIQFTSGNIGTKTATIQISSNDTDENPYNFVIQGNACPIIYVNHAAQGDNNGTSWTDAYTSLQAAIEAHENAFCNSEIWVAGGIYRPTKDKAGNENVATDRNNLFYLKGNKTILGGFNGTPGQEGNINDRDILNNPTILDGDLDEDGMYEGNARRIVQIENAQEVHLDGLRIQNGYSDEDGGVGVYVTNINNGVVYFNNVEIAHNYSSYQYSRGVGIYISGNEGKVFFDNCAIHDNIELNQNNNGFISGGGIYCQNVVDFSMNNCSVYNNRISQQGGGLYFSSSNAQPKLINCTFFGNVAGEGGSNNQEGGGIYVSSADTLHLINCTIVENEITSGGANRGGGIYFDGNNLKIINSIIANNGGNTENVQGKDLWDDGSNTDETIFENSLIEDCFCKMQPTYSNDPNLTGVAFCGIQAYFTPLSPSEALDNASEPTGCIPTTDICGNQRQTPNDLGSIDATALPAHLTIRGNNIAIISADDSPSEEDATDFGIVNKGNSISHTFTMKNEGGELLILNNHPNIVSIAGSNDFSIEQQASNASLAPNATDMFKIKFEPGQFGVQQATISIESNAPSWTTYTFVIEGKSCPETDTLYVDQTANGANTGATWTDAFTDLQAAIDLAKICGNTEIWVARGTYFPNKDKEGNSNPTDNRNKTFYFDFDIKIYGGFPSGGGDMASRMPATNPTILDGDLGNDNNIANNAYSVIHTKYVGRDFLLDGFTIQDGNADASTSIILEQSTGGGWFNDASRNNNLSKPSIINCLFLNNQAINGGGFYTIAEDGTSSPIFNNCIFRGNQATENGGAIFNNADRGNDYLQLTNTLFDNNQAGSAAGALYNNRKQGGGTSNPKIINCTFYANTAMNDAGAVFIEENTYPSIKNCIFWNNQLNGQNNVTGADIKYDTENSELLDKIGYSIFQEDSDFSNSMGAITNQNPLFINAANGDFHLQNTSPAIDMGKNLVVMQIPIQKDADQKLRIINNTVDLGIYESGINACPTGDVVYVDSSATTGANNGTDWANAYTNLKSAVYTACACDKEIWVAEGTYFPTSDKDYGGNGATDVNNTFYFNCDVKIYGSFKGTMGKEGDFSDRDLEQNPSILNGNIDMDDNSIVGNAKHVVYTENLSSSFLMDGFHIKNGNTPRGRGIGGGAWFNDGSGAGNRSNPTIKNCVFANNNSTIGGAFYNKGNSGGEASPVIENCTFKENHTSRIGGAIYTSGIGSSTTILNTTFIKNDAGSSGGALNFSHTNGLLKDCQFIDNISNSNGGGIYSTGNSFLTVENCQFINNVSNSSGGGIYNTSNASLILENCAFMRNESSTSSGGAVYNDASILKMDSCTLTSNKATDGGALYNDSSNPIIQNSTFSKNLGTDEGGAIYNTDEAFPTINNCLFEDNRGDYGGAIYAYEYGVLKITNCVFVRDSAHYGGAIYTNDYHSIITNCTFTKNVSENKGGLLYNNGASNATFVNSILWDNGDEIYQEDANYMTNLSYCIFDDGTINNSIDLPSNVTDGGNNLDTNPQFVDAMNDLSLATGSVGIDAGNNAALPVEISLDIAGKPRIFSNKIDIGAYEFFIPLSSNAGVDQLDICGMNTNLAATPPSLGTGIWKLVEGDDKHTFENQHQANSMFSGSPGISYTLEWVVTFNGCCAARDTVIISFMVDQASIGGNIAGSTTVCTSTNSSTLTLSEHTGEIIKWQMADNTSFNNPINIANTNSTYTATNLSETTYFRAEIKNGNCDATYSTTAVIMVDAGSVGGTIAGSTTVCTGTNSTLLTLSGHTGSIQKWQKADNPSFNTPTDITNTNSTYTATNLSETTYFRAEIKNGACNSTYSNTVIITVDQLTIGGIIEGAEMVCSGLNLLDLNLTGHLGQVLKWQSDTDINFNNPTNIANASSTLTVEDLTQTTHYRVLVQNGSCAQMFSASATITVDNLDLDNNNVPDCQEACLEHLTVSGTLGAPISSGIYKAVKTIESDGSILGDGVVVFQAGQSITLTDGFSVAAGGDFTAIITPCTTNSLADADEVLPENSLAKNE